MSKLDPADRRAWLLAAQINADVRARATCELESLAIAACVPVLPPPVFLTRTRCPAHPADVNFTEVDRSAPPHEATPYVNMKVKPEAADDSVRL